MSTLQKVLDYWFSTPNDYQKWFFSGSSLDNYIKIEFEPLLLEVLDNNKKYNPKNTKEILAKIILLDQFSRHMYRNSDKAYACDIISLNLSLKMLNNSTINELSSVEQLFALMPLQHSENIQHKNILLTFANDKLNTSNEYDKNIYSSIIEHTKNHRTVLELFGRYPKRNQFLGRVSTPEEILYIKEFQHRDY